ncbi:MULTISPECIES: Atu4866 domain-containing protein [Actinosynnema]|uniref:Atu4866 domain-containing protein n=1 Tax=Actinosynnema TaxID=40566 RepID=UPI0020A3E02D|nr:Atu4866 domain-containing protein [Actinosynnema pretiosum]MCP2096551.1 protein Atu4866 [Actinosynnema pretiosum]
MATLTTDLPTRARSGTPLLFTGATTHTLDPSLGAVTGGLLVEGGTITGVDVADHPGAHVVDCAGLVIVPAVADGVDLPGRHANRLHPLTRGNPATFALVRGGTDLESVIWWPRRAAAVVVEGDFAFLAGRRLLPPPPSAPTPVRAESSPHLGTWTDEPQDVVQDLTPDGRYTEARNGVRDAYRGSFWLAHDHIAYRDDLGFWAYGTFEDDVLHHAHFTFRR